MRPKKRMHGCWAEYARAGDADAKAFFDHIGTMLGKGLALLTDTLNPEKIVIGSVFVRCEDLLRPAMEAELKREAIPFSLEGLQVVPAQTGEALGDLASIMTALYGCGVDPMEETEEKAPGVLEHYERLFRRYPALEGLREPVMEAYLLLRRCYAQGGKLLIVGNGGSCADAGHMVGELMKGFYLKRPFPEKQRAAIAAQTEAMLPGAAEKLQPGLAGHRPDAARGAVYRRAETSGSAFDGGAADSRLRKARRCDPGHQHQRQREERGAGHRDGQGAGAFRHRPDRRQRRTG